MDGFGRRYGSLLLEIPLLAGLVVGAVVFFPLLSLIDALRTRTRK